YLPDHIQPFPPVSLEQWLIVVLDMLSFVPVGFLIVLARRPPVRPVLASLLGAAIIVVLAAGKFLFHARHTSLAIAAMEGSAVQQCRCDVERAAAAWRSRRAAAAVARCRGQAERRVSVVWSRGIT